MHSTPLYQKVKSTIAPFVDDNQTSFTIALSGGVDSVVLLHVMNEMKREIPALQLSAVYVNHGLSNYADDWQQFCADLCRQLNVAFTAAPVTIEQRSRTSLEEQARDARYLALDEYSAKGSVILLGQHLNDQLETFLLRLKRGSGLKGLASMRQTRRLSSGRVCFRPLLNVTRCAIESFAKVFSLAHITDDSNTDERFDRNFIRQKVVPVLSDKFTGFEKSASRSISLLQQQQDLLHEYSLQDLAKCQNETQGLSCGELAMYSAARQANVLRCWLEQFTALMPSQKQTEQILEQGINAQVDAQLKIQLKDGDICRHQSFLYFVKHQTQEPLVVTERSDNTFILNNGAHISVVQGKGVRLPQADEHVTVRFDYPQEKIKPLNKPGRNTLKHWFKDAKVAPWLRASVPLIFYNDELVQVVGYFISANHVSDEGIFWEYHT
ncbi:MULTISPECIES: tRNA lysidine(34) synthetase TilS [unclassified Pseudoalteromonas]|uniref:tRNA lysidine(34) synthetase TilS n=1 Tax=unclassified Pseudoalteromonas TaxID=194690 RepID=UPI0025B2FA79|nr:MULTISPECIES: tRNA lysidine(34) synthetase TilS [unclassified Pseudoalteromonas]MDN3377970.1 tRNA lysidine(34) synthetase TilS [Pseudoalteromonas sp. APC 3893]MDN3386736.1 tRNA lysidine(34) synthetase TilS [Pseudoalteromonas sp. APC 4017]